MSQKSCFGPPLVHFLSTVQVFRVAGLGMMRKGAELSPKSNGLDQPQQHKAYQSFKFVPWLQLAHQRCHLVFCPTCRRFQSRFRTPELAILPNLRLRLGT